MSNEQKELVRTFLLSSANTEEKFVLDINLQTSQVTLKQDNPTNDKSSKQVNQQSTYNVSELTFPSDSDADIIFPGLKKQLQFENEEEKSRCQKIHEALIDVPDAYRIFRTKVPQGSTILPSQIRQALQLTEDDDEPEDTASKEEEVGYEDFLLYYRQIKHGGSGIVNPIIVEENEPSRGSRIFASSVHQRPECFSPVLAKAETLNARQKPITDPTLYGGESMFVGEKPCCLGTNLEEGFLWLTTYRLIFVHKETRNSTHIPLTLMREAEKDSNSMTFFLYDNRCLKITFGSKRKDSQTVGVSVKWIEGFFSQIMRIAFPGPKRDSKSKENVFAFSYKPELKIEDEYNGWKFYDAAKEYDRLGLTRNPKVRLTRINIKYELCSTYPKLFCVPKLMMDEDLERGAKFRSRCRLPAIVYMHPETEAFLVRCAQPLSGLQKKRNDCDEKMVKAIRLSTPYRDHLENKLHFIDCRPAITAKGNMCMGKGYEMTDFYELTQIHFCKIDNIHKIRNSLEKLADVCSTNFSGFLRDDYRRFHSDIAASEWMYYIGLILTASIRQANILTQGESLICHCSDGWDRTSQVVSITKLLLDPYYRTIKGFAILIEQEWLSFGHKFSERCGHGDPKETNQRAPIFTQWLDCIWQIWRQFPQSFEFSEEFLIALADEVYACRFGTFLFDCVREREKAKLKETTISIWSELCHPQNKIKYYNPLYLPHPNRRRWMFLDCSPLKIRLWERLHLRYNWATPVQESNHEAIAELGKKMDILTDKLKELNVDVDALLAGKKAGKASFHDPFHQGQGFVDLGGTSKDEHEKIHQTGPTSPDSKKSNRLKGGNLSLPQSKSSTSSRSKIFAGISKKGFRASPRHKSGPNHSKSESLSKPFSFQKKGIPKSNSFTTDTTSVASAVSSDVSSRNRGKANGK